MGSLFQELSTACQASWVSTAAHRLAGDAAASAIAGLVHWALYQPWFPGGFPVVDELVGRALTKAQRPSKTLIWSRFIVRDEVKTSLNFLKVEVVDEKASWAFLLVLYIVDDTSFSL
jgi:hypothetical protein